MLKKFWTPQKAICRLTSKRPLAFCAILRHSMPDEDEIKKHLTLEWRGFRATYSDLVNNGWEITILGGAGVVYIQTDCWEHLHGEIEENYHVRLRELNQCHAFLIKEHEIPRLLMFIQEIQRRFSKRPYRNPSENVISIARHKEAK
jgi:hypothetical protein